jgi:hypothetical protein
LEDEPSHHVRPGEVGMKIYIAGRLSQRNELHDIRKRLSNLGYEVVSSWIDETPQPTGIMLALRDLVQIAIADVIILDTTSPLSEDGGGGREFEAGFTIGQFQHSRLWRVGPVKNIFHHLAEQSWSSWEDFFLCQLEQN